MTEERRAECIIHSEKLARIDTNLAKIEKTLSGNGVMGTVTQAKLAYDEMKKRLDNKDKIKFDVYRWVIFAILAFIAAKVGLK